MFAVFRSHFRSFFLEPFKDQSELSVESESDMTTRRRASIAALEDLEQMASIPNVHTPLLGGKAWEGTQRTEGSKLSSSLHRGHLVRVLVVTVVLSVCFIRTTQLLLSPSASIKLNPANVVAALRHHLPAPTCDPFALPGLLSVDLSWAANVSWKPFDTTCPPSHLTPDVRATLLDESLDDGEVRAKLSWLVGRTVLKIGDSVDRCHVEDVCSFFGGTSQVIGDGHRYAPGNFTNGRDEDVINPTVYGKRDWLALPHLCTIPRIDLRIVNIFHFGLATFEESKSTGVLFNEMHYRPPAEFKDRLAFMAVGLMERIGARHPDIVSFNSLLWDMSHLTEVDRKNHLPEKHLQPEQQDYYRTRLDTALSQVEQAFPQSHLIWRSGHAIECSPKHLIPCVRVDEARAISLDVIARSHPKFAIDPIGRLLDGQVYHFRDGIHPGIEYAGIWADILLFKLRSL